MTSTDLAIEDHFISNGAGWQLHLKVTRSPQHLDKAHRPLLIVPGYGMNSFIFGFHPRGTSMERCLAEAGIEVWSVNMRKQGRATPEGPHAAPPSLRGFAEVDLTAAVQGVLARTQTEQDRVDVLGASLGGSIVYAHLALVPDHRIGSVVSIGAPLRWVEVHPILKTAFASPRVASLLRLSGTRQMARVALPLLARLLPKLLAIYMNTNLVDITQVDQLTQTVEDPHPRVNSDIAKWIGARDMFLRGVDVTAALAKVERPLLVVLANRDGIVPTATVMSVIPAWGGSAETLHVGDDEHWYAHADLFVGDPAPETVFAPIAAWLRAQHAA